MTGIGSPRIKQSPRMLAVAFAYQKAVKLMQCPSILWFHARSMGMHCKIVATILAKAYKTT